MHSVQIGDFIGIFRLQLVEPAVLFGNNVDTDSQIHMQALCAYVFMCVHTCDLYHFHESKTKSTTRNGTSTDFSHFSLW